MRQRSNAFSISGTLSAREAAIASAAAAAANRANSNTHPPMQDLKRLFEILASRPINCCSTEARLGNPRKRHKQ